MANPKKMLIAIIGLVVQRIAQNRAYILAIGSILLLCDLLLDVQLKKIKRLLWPITDLLRCKVPFPKIAECSRPHPRL